MSVARNKSYSNRRAAASGFYQGTVTEVVTAEIDPFGIRVDVPRLGHKNAGPFPYVGPPPALGDSVWVSFQESRSDELLVFNSGHQDGDDITEGTYRFGGQVEEWGVTLHIEPTSYTGSSRASLRFDKTLFGGGGGSAGVNGTTSGDFFAYDYNTGHWLISHTGAWGSFATGKEDLANWIILILRFTVGINMDTLVGISCGGCSFIPVTKTVLVLGTSVLFFHGKIKAVLEPIRNRMV